MKVTLLNQPQLTMTEAKSNGKFIKVEAKPTAKGNGEFEITGTLDPDCPKGNWMSEVFLTTNVRGLEKIRIPVTVNVVPVAATAPDVVTESATRYLTSVREARAPDSCMWTPRPPDAAQPKLLL